MDIPGHLPGAVDQGGLLLRLRQGWRPHRDARLLLVHGQPGAGGAGAGMMWDEGFHSRQGPKKGWFILENPSKMDDEMRYPHVRKPPEYI